MIRRGAGRQALMDKEHQRPARNLERADLSKAIIMLARAAVGDLTP